MRFVMRSALLLSVMIIALVGFLGRARTGSNRGVTLSPEGPEDEPALFVG